MKNSLEIIIKQVRLESGFQRGGRIRVAECLRIASNPDLLKCPYVRGLLTHALIVRLRLQNSCSLVFIFRSGKSLVLPTMQSA